MSGGMGGISMGSGVPNLFYMQQMFWAAVGAAIACATLVNVLNKLIYRQRYDSPTIPTRQRYTYTTERLQAAQRNHPTPAKPNSLFFASYATTTAIVRELANASLPIVLTKRLRWNSPTLGRIALVLAELTLVMVLCFYALDPSDQWQWEDIGYRTGFIAAAQLPLVVILAGKNNIIGFLVGSSYERLNWLHRWSARILFLTATIHMGFWFTDWARYDYIMTKLTTDVITQRGFAAWCILLCIVLSSFAPIRKWNYEFFVIQHILTFIGFLVAVFLHLPAEVKVWIWLPIGFYIFDRTVRTVVVFHTNLSIFHPRLKNGSFWTCKVTLEPLCSGTTRMIINNPPISWKAGQHVSLSCHGISPFQSHPFTIASIPEDGRMEFLVKSKAGGTKKFYAKAEKHQSLPVLERDARSTRTCHALIDGPYGRMRPLNQFDSVFLIAGSSGAAFTMPLMREVIASWKMSASGFRSRSIFRGPEGAATRYIRFVWIVKSRSQTQWFANQLAQVAQDVQQLRQEGQDVDVDISVYITCDENLEAETNSAQHPALRLNGPHSKPEQIQIKDISAATETEKAKQETISVHSTGSLSTNEKPPTKTSCGPNGTCCCTTTIEDEDAITNSASKQQCCCCNPSSSSSSSSISMHNATDKKESQPPTYSEKGNDVYRNDSVTDSDASNTSSSPLSTEKPSSARALLHPSISLLTGRPKPKTLIRKTLEQALGESAVVVCGPRGLEEDVRSSVVALSDERGVCKGTGAMGVWVWGEGFEY